MRVELSSEMQKIERLRKVSTHVSLRGLRRLTGVDTFRKCIKPPFHRAWHIYFIVFSSHCQYL